MQPEAMLENRVQPPGFRKALLLTILFGVLGYGGNLARLPIGFNLAFIFGSIFTLTCTVLLGWRWGLASTLLASLYTYFLWNHPYAIAILGAESLWVGLALRRGHRNLLLIDTLYWLLVGAPLVFFFYGGIQHLALEVTAATALKQAINGITNALLAGAILTYLPVETWLGLATGPKRYPLGSVLFDLTLLFLLLPAIFMIITISRREIRLGQQKVVTELTMEATYREGLLLSWVDRQMLAITRVAELGHGVGKTPSSLLQEDLEQIHSFSPDFRTLILADAQARSLLFDPPVNDQGKSNIGLDFSDHPYAQQVKATMQPLISDVFMGSRAAFRPIFTISVPWEKEGQYQGFGTGAVNLDVLQQVLTRAQGQNPPFLCLLDQQGKVVISTDPAHQPLSQLSDLPGTRIEQISAGVSLHIPPTRKNISVMDTWKNAYYATRLPVTGTPWTLLVLRSAGPLQVRAFQLVLWTLAGLAGLFLLLLLVASLVAKALSQAMVKLASFSVDLPLRVERGEALEWPTSRFEEVAQMATQFQSTSEALGIRIQQQKEATERRMETERAMNHQARLAAMGEMIGNIAHQWRQPLNSLSMLLANLKDAFQHRELDSDGMERSFSKGEALIQQMSATISDFMNFFHPGKEMIAFSCLQQIQSTLGLLEGSFLAAQIKIQVEAPRDVRLFGYPNEYSQVLLNLLSNARQAIESTQANRGGRISVHLWEEQGAGWLTVSDTGGGIPPDLLDRIFEPYFSTKGHGSGLGLYMSRQIIEGSMGGQIDARNIEHGAEFTVRVPVAGERP